MALHRNRLCSLLSSVCRAQSSRMLSTSIVRLADSKVTTAPKSDEPIKFTASDAYVDYKARYNFRGGDDRDLPKSHNFFLTGTGIFGFYYLIFLRDDIENDGGQNLFKPIHETVPEMAIPMIQAAIVENRKMGYNTKKLEKKLAELMKEPEKHGAGRPKLIEN